MKILGIAVHKTAFSLLLILLWAFAASAPAPAQALKAGEGAATRKGASGLPLPRFVSLKSNRVNLRKGPSLDHPIAWEFKRVGLPVEVVAEFENWRRIRYSDGTEGWVFHSLLSGRRTGVVTPWAEDGETTPLYDRPSTSGEVIARLAPGVLGSLMRCDGSWCKFSLDSVSGWIEQVKLWGVYKNEVIE